jgi:hypothetical protein
MLSLPVLWRRPPWFVRQFSIRWRRAPPFLIEFKKPWRGPPLFLSPFKMRWPGQPMIIFRPKMRWRRAPLFILPLALQWRGLPFAGSASGLPAPPDPDWHRGRLPGGRSAGSEPRMEKIRSGAANRFPKKIRTDEPDRKWHARSQRFSSAGAARRRVSNRGSTHRLDMDKNIIDI